MLYSMSAMQDFDPRIEVIYMKKRILKSVSALLLLAVTAASASPFVMHLSAASSSVSEWERQRQELQDKIDEYTKSIEAAKNDINGALERKAQIDEQSHRNGERNARDHIQIAHRFGPSHRARKHCGRKHAYCRKHDIEHARINISGWFGHEIPFIR